MTNNFHFINNYYIIINNINEDYKYYFHYINKNYYFYIKNKKKNKKENFFFKIIKNNKIYNYSIKNEKNNIIKLNSFNLLNFTNNNSFNEEKILNEINTTYPHLSLFHYKENLFDNDYIKDEKIFNKFLKLNWYFFGKNNNFQYFKYIIYKLKDSILKINYTKIDYNDNKKYSLFFIDDRFDSIFKYILILFLYSIDNKWNLNIFTIKKNEDLYLKVLKDLGIEAKINIINKINSKKDYSMLLMNYNFWKNINEEYVLLFQYDSLAFKKFNYAFLQYDYLGARWPENITQLSNIYNGNGGTSLRKINTMKYITSKYNYNIHGFNKHGDELPEDVYFAKYIHNEGLNNVDSKILDDFSFECIYNENSTYGHAIYESINLNNLEQFITNKINNMVQ